MRVRFVRGGQLVLIVVRNVGGVRGDTGFLLALNHVWRVGEIGMVGVIVLRSVSFEVRMHLRCWCFWLLVEGPRARFGVGLSVGSTAQRRSSIHLGTGVDLMAPPFSFSSRLGRYHQ